MIIGHFDYRTVFVRWFQTLKISYDKVRFFCFFRWEVCVCFQNPNGSLHEVSTNTGWRL